MHTVLIVIMTILYKCHSSVRYTTLKVYKLFVLLTQGLLGLKQILQFNDSKVK